MAAAIVGVLTALHITPVNAGAVTVSSEFTVADTTDAACALAPVPAASAQFSQRVMFGSLPKAQEGAGLVQVPVLRPVGAGVATVRYATTTAPPPSRRNRVLPPGGWQPATPGADYQAVSGELSFAAGETSKAISIPLMDDAVTEEPEFIGLLLTSATGDASIRPSDGSAAIPLFDNEPSPPPILNAAPVQRLRRWGVRFTVTPRLNASRLQLTGTVTVRALRKNWKLSTQRPRQPARAGVELGFAIGLPLRARGRLEQAADDGKRISAVVKVTAVDGFGRKSFSAVRVRLR